MPKCVIFKTGVTIGPTGAVRPCCAFDTNGVPNMSFDKDWRSRHDKWDKQQEEGWLRHCKECKQSEDLGKQSLRQHYNKKMRDDTDIVYWDLKINNTCNLACRMCDKTSSSVWQQIVKENSDEKWDKHYTVRDNNRWHKDSINMVQHMEHAKVVKFTGGEPMMIPQVRKIIEALIEKGHSKNIQLHMITNGSFDLMMWDKYFKEFKKVWINISIDAIGKRYEYIRPLSNWKTVEDNVIKFNELKRDNCTIFITTLPMLLNKDHLHEVDEWMLKHDLDGETASPIIYPDFLRLNALEDEKLTKKFIEQMTIQDRIHGTDYREFVDIDDEERLYIQKDLE